MTSVAVFAFDESGNIVGTIEHRGPDLLGGHMQIGENTFAETARRESEEEGGVTIEDEQVPASLAAGLSHRSYSAPFVKSLMSESFADIRKTVFANRLAVSINNQS